MNKISSLPNQINMNNETLKNLSFSIENLNIDEDGIKELKKGITQLEKKIRERNKPKTITISGKDHSIIKKYCQELNLNIGEWSSKVLLSEVSKNECVIVDDRTSEEIKKSDSEILLDKYSRLKGVLYKLDKLVNNKEFILRGYSYVDGLPIYEYLGTEQIQKNADGFYYHQRFEQEVKLSLIKPNELSLNVSNYDLPIFGH